MRQAECLKKDVNGTEYLTMIGASKQLGIHINSLSKYVARKEIRVLKLCGHNLFLPNWLEEFVTRHTESPKR